MIIHNVANQGAARLGKICRKLPVAVVKEYELWKDIVFRHGPEKLKEFPGFHDEKLKGERTGQRASRLRCFPSICMHAGRKASYRGI